MLRTPTDILRIQRANTVMEASEGSTLPEIVHLYGVSDRLNGRAAPAQHRLG